MSDEQLDVARRLQEYHREQFGYATSNVTIIKVSSIPSHLIRA